MDYIAMIEKAREELLQEVNRRCDDLIRRYQEEEQGISPKTEVRERTLAWISPASLKGKRPVALTFASGEVVLTPTWKKVVQTILKHCNEQPDMHERLMQLRGRVFGRQRTLKHGRSGHGLCAFYSHVQAERIPGFGDGADPVL